MDETESAQIFDALANALATNGRYVGASIFEPSLTAALLTRAQSLAQSGLLQAARVGRAEAASHAGALRGDRTQWLADQPDNAVERAAVLAVDALRISLNRALFLGARSTELHFAHYPPGAFYKTHRDRFSDDGARLISLVFYLNADWLDEAGGALVIYDDTMNELQRVAPRAGTMVAFRSERFPHEVLSGAQDRFTLTGWLRNDRPDAVNLF